MEREQLKEAFIKATDDTTLDVTVAGYRIRLTSEWLFGRRFHVTDEADGGRTVLKYRF